jgi:hypothetical protein
VNMTVSRGAVYITTAILGLVAFHSMMLLLVHKGFDSYRLLKSMVLLIILVLGAFAFYKNVENLPQTSLINSSLILMLFFIVLGVISPLDLDQIHKNARKPILFFSEPSHYALAISPLLLFVLTIARPRFRGVLIIAVLITALIVKSMTLLIALSFFSILVVNAKLSVIVLSTAAITYVVGVDKNEFLSYFIERTKISFESTNSSVLVFLKGWEEAYLNFWEFRGMGVGFQQLGYFGQGGAADSKLSELGMAGLNRFDGGTIGSKLISEFGLLGVSFVVLYLYVFMRSVGELRRASRSSKIYDPTRIFFLSCFVAFAIDLFVRGTNYFSESSFLLLAALFALAARKKASSVVTTKMISQR